MMIKKLNIASIALIIAFISASPALAGTILSVNDIDIANYKKNDKEDKNDDRKLVNPDFTQGAHGWNLGEGFSIDANGGTNLTPGLFYERKDPEKYSLCSQKFKFEPGKKYKFSASIKTENVTNSKSTTEGASICFEVHENDKWICGDYISGINGTKDWTTVEGSFSYTGNNNNATGSVTLYMRKNTTGKAWFDDVKVEVIDNEKCNIRQIYPKFNSISAEDGKAVFKITFPGNNSPSSEYYCYVSMQIKEKTALKYLVPIPANGIVEFDFGKNKSGPAEIDFKIINPAKKELIEEQIFNINIYNWKTIPANACLIDEKGWAIVNGKPFFPIGLYMGNIEKEDIQRLSKTGFNCVIPYGSQYLKFKDTKKQGTEAVREVLDALNEANIKIIYSIKDVYDDYPVAGKKFTFRESKNGDDCVEKTISDLKDHPALLSWYICDEMGVNWIKKLEERKRKINALDPYHPTWSVYYKFYNLDLFAGTSDVLGVDPYPISKPGVHDMKLVREGMDAANNAVASDKGAAVWGVPQFHNLANYSKNGKDQEARAKNYAAPTEDEMRAMCLLMVIKGAKGIIGYSYFDIFAKGCGAEPEAEKRWTEICKVAETLRSLEPFILSNKNGPDIKVDIQNGEVHAKAFSDDHGNVKILITGCGPEESKAVISIPGGKKFKSRFDKTKSSGNGLYLFENKGICSDILE